MCTYYTRQIMSFYKTVVKNPTLILIRCERKKDIHNNYVDNILLFSPSMHPNRFAPINTHIYTNIHIHIHIYID